LSPKVAKVGALGSTFCPPRAASVRAIGRGRAGAAMARRRVAQVTCSAELGKRHGELSTEIREVEHVRAVAERELLDYRQTLAATF
jgi:hypothetical protein